MRNSEGDCGHLKWRLIIPHMCSSSSILNRGLSKYLMALIFLKTTLCFVPNYHTFTLHLEIKLSIRIKHRHPTELKILNLILLYLPLDRSTHLTLRSAYNLCKYKCSEMTESKDAKSHQCRIVSLNG